MPIRDWKRNNVAKIFSLPKFDSVLDVACGLSLKSKFITADSRVGVDIHEEYFKHIKSDVPYTVVKYDVRKLSDIFIPKSFDLVIAMDIIEHLEKEEGLELLRQCEKIARKAVIFETPEGYIPQNIDIQGHGGDHWQTHRSGWLCTDFSRRGYKVKVRNYKMSDKKRHTDIKVSQDIRLIDAIKWLES